MQPHNLSGYRIELGRYLSADKVGKLIKDTKAKVRKERRTSPRFYQNKHVKCILYNILESYRNKV